MNTQDTEESLQKELEKRFIAWAEARDDDWWEEGQGSISIWDVRIMLGFFTSELTRREREVRNKTLREIYQAGLEDNFVYPEKEGVV